MKQPRPAREPPSDTQAESVAVSIGGPSLYELLGVDREATPAEIGRGFKRAIQLWHPDLHAEVQATEKTRNLLDAWRVLRDPARRAGYDASSLNVRTQAPGNAQFVRRASLLRRLGGGGLECVSTTAGLLLRHHRRSDGRRRAERQRQPRSPAL